jgi:hypothetical protein
MLPFAEVAVRFAQALVDGRYAEAWHLLTPETQAEYGPDQLRERFRSMYQGCAPDAKAERILFDPEFCGTESPDSQHGDAGWVYVAIEGVGFMEAVTVVISDVGGPLRVRRIVWGRP